MRRVFAEKRRQYKLKLYSTRIRIDTGRPSNIAGVNLIRRAAAIALSFNPSGRPVTTLISATCPLAVKTTLNTTVPLIWFLRATSV